MNYINRLFAAFKPYNNSPIKQLAKLKVAPIVLKPIPPLDPPIKDKLIIYTVNAELESIKELGFETYTYLDKPIEDLDNCVVLRAGNSQIAYNRNREEGEFKNVINIAEAIKLNVRKDKALKELSKVVNTPRLWVARQRVPKNKKVVLRTNNHSGGEGFEVVNGGFTVKDGMHCTEYIKSNQEYRVYYCMGKTFMASRITDSKKQLKKEFKCRSLWGYQFWNGVPKSLREIAEKASKILNLDFCCYDIILGVKDKKYYVLEGNSSPTIGDPEIRAFYQKSLLYGIKQKFPDVKVTIPKKPRKTQIESIW